MILRHILITLSPLIISYFIFRRYALFYPDILKQVQSIIGGMIAALILLLSAPLLNIALPDAPLAVEAFIKAALSEKLAMYLILSIILYQFSDFSPIEGALAGMLAGFGFSIVENSAFAINYSASAFPARMVFTVPMHIASCGILGCHMAQGKLSHTALYHFRYTFSGILLVTLLHGSFDYFLLSGSHQMMISAPIVLITVFIFVVKLNRSRLAPGREVFKIMGMGYEEWLHIARQSNYDRWMRRSMGISIAHPVGLLDWRPGAGQMISIFLFLCAALFGGIFYQSISRMFAITPQEAQLVFIFFPFSSAVMIVIVNSVNPDFFRYRELKIPVMSNISWENSDGFGENHISYDISPVSIFINTYEDAGIGNTLEIEIEIPNLTSAKARGTVIWEQHQPGLSANGTLVRLNKAGFSFLFLVMIRYTLFRFAKGIIYNLNLPGSDSVKKLFVHPVSAMSNDRLYKKGEVIYREGDIAGNFFYLKRGMVELRVKKNDDEIITVNTIPGETIFGENSLFSPAKRSNTAVAVMDSLISTADTSNLHILVRNNTEFAMQLFDTLAKRIAETERSLLDHIKQIEQKQVENFGLYHSLATIILLGLTGADMRLDRSYPLTKIMKILQNINEEITLELAMLLHSAASGENVDKAFNRLETLYQKTVSK